MGDIIISEPIARYYYEQGYKILFWVVKEFYWIKDYIPYIEFIPEEYIFPFNEPVYDDQFIFLPLISLRISSYGEWIKTGWLYDKYRIANLDYSLWKTFNFKRNFFKEKRLFDYLELDKNENYIVVNKNSSNGYRSDITINTDIRVIEMQEIEGFTMLDWYRVLKHAQEVHTVSTSVVYPLIKMKHKNVTIYRRSFGDGTFNAIVEPFKEFNFKYEE